MMLRTSQLLFLPVFFLCVADKSFAERIGFNLSAPNDNIPKNFVFYWNIPTYQCRKYNMSFQNVSQSFGFVQNEKDNFRGDKIAILYDTGNFPALLTADKDKIVRRNGAVPQMGNLTEHLKKFKQHVEEQIPNATFKGIVVIDFENWRPVFRQNWGTMEIYRNMSYDIERQLNPREDEKTVHRKARSEWEKSARVFMKRTIEYARELRPFASWAYYGYPFCFNWSDKQQSEECSAEVKKENDNMSWLFGNSKLLVPSTYFNQNHNSSQRVGLVRGRVNEALRVARNVKNRKDVKVMPYYWFRDRSDTFLEKKDLVNTLSEIIKLGADGVIIWESSNNVNSADKCESFLNYLQNILGPTVLELKQQWKI